MLGFRMDKGKIRQKMYWHNFLNNKWMFDLFY